MWKKVTLPAFSLILSLNSYPASIGFDQEIPVQVSLYCTSCGDSYIRAVFFPSGTSYFGFTKNDRGEWIGTSADKTLYYHIPESETKTGTWSGILTGKLDTQNPAYKGPGKYYFKVIRYTNSGSKSGETQTVDIEVSGPEPATPVPVSSSNPVSIPVPTIIMSTIDTPSRIVNTLVTPQPSIFTRDFTQVPAQATATGTVVSNEILLPRQEGQDPGSAPGRLITGIIITSAGLLLTGISALLLFKKSGKIFNL